MAIGSVFINNGTLSVRLPAETRFPESVSRLTLLGLVFQMALAAEKDWRRISGFKKVTDVINAVRGFAFRQSATRRSIL